jgi:hypothetical protein
MQFFLREERDGKTGMIREGGGGDESEGELATYANHHTGRDR